MLHSVVFNTGDYEIHIDKQDKWTVTIYRVKHAVKELFEQHVFDSYSNAYRFVEKQFLQVTVV